jgi:hypothetical protein
MPPPPICRAVIKAAAPKKSEEKSTKKENWKEDRHKINEEGCEETGCQENKKDSKEVRCSSNNEGKAKIKEVGILKVPTRGFLQSLARW